MKLKHVRPQRQAFSRHQNALKLDKTRYQSQLAR